MKYDFDKAVDRRGSNCVKWDGMKHIFGGDDLIPLWVADMDFETPDFVMEALRKRLEHPVLGYTETPDSYWQSIIDWQRRRNGWALEREWIEYIPGIVKGIGMVVNVFTEPGDKVIVQPPVYHPFHIVSRELGRQVVWNPLVSGEDSYYRMDFEHLESIIDEKTKVLILSNPHNPVGIAWDRESLKRLAEICHRRGVLVISDEIHSDLTLFGRKHIPFATVSQEAAACSITFAAPSKTFNIAGVVSSYSVIPDREIREKFYGWLHAFEMASPHMFAPIATEAAYRYGEEWLGQMLVYVEDNVRFVEEFCSAHFISACGLPLISPVRPEASFLVWLDCRALFADKTGLKVEGNEKEAAQFLAGFFKDAGLALNEGSIFGPGGAGYMRLNIGTARSILKESLERLSAHLKR